MKKGINDGALAMAGKAILALENVQIIDAYFKSLPSAGDQDDRDERAARKHLGAIFDAALKSKFDQ